MRWQQCEMRPRVRAISPWNQPSFTTSALLPRSLKASYFAFLSGRAADYGAGMILTGHPQSDLYQLFSTVPSGP